MCVVRKFYQLCSHSLLFTTLHSNSNREYRRILLSLRDKFLYNESIEKPSPTQISFSNWYNIKMSKWCPSYILYNNCSVSEKLNGRVVEVYEMWKTISIIMLQSKTNQTHTKSNWYHHKILFGFIVYGDETWR